MKIVIVGNGPAAVKALEAIAVCRASLPADDLEITVISPERTAAYFPMFLAEYLTGELGEAEMRLEESHGLLPERLLGEKVVEVKDTVNRVILASGQGISYDKLLIASGASPLKPPIRGIDKEGVYFFNRLEDARKLIEQIPSVRDVIIVGAGAIGIETAIAFQRMGKNVLVVEMLCQCLPQMLDEDLAGYLEGKLSSLGIRFMLGECVSEIMGDNRARGIVVGDKEISGDLVLVACGFSPNIDFLRSSGVRVNQGVLVDEKMRTNVPNIYAAGDVAESLDPYGGHELVFNWYNAIDQGWTAGCNLVGVDSTCQASPTLAVLKGLEIPVVSVGRKYSQDGYEILSNASQAAGIYEKIFIKNNRIDCYQAIGVSDKVGLMYGYIRERKDIGGIKNRLCGDYATANLVT